MSACASGAARTASIGFEILAGGGLGRTPILGKVIREFLPQADLLAYLEAILRVYNRYGRRDNIHKARIKILVRALGVEEFTRQVEQEFEAGSRIRAARSKRRSRAHARILRAAAVPAADRPADAPAIASAAQRRAGLRRLAALQHARATRSRAIAS